MSGTKKDKSENILIIAIFALILILGSVFAWTKFKNTEFEEEIPPPPPNPNPNTTPVANDNFPLVKGSTGANVKYLQGAINRIFTNPAFKVSEDGIFGAQTYTSLISGVGITTWWDKTKINTYPVTLDAFNSIMHKSNASRFSMDGKIYTVRTIVEQP